MGVVVKSWYFQGEWKPFRKGEAKQSFSSRLRINGDHFTAAASDKEDSL